MIRQGLQSTWIRRLFLVSERAHSVLYAGGDDDDVARATKGAPAMYSNALRPAKEIVLQLTDS